MNKNFVGSETTRMIAKHKACILERKMQSQLKRIMNFQIQSYYVSHFILDFVYAVTEILKKKICILLSLQAIYTFLHRITISKPQSYISIHISLLYFTLQSNIAAIVDPNNPTLWYLPRYMNITNMHFNILSMIIFSLYTL